MNLGHYKIEEAPEFDRADCDILIAVNERYNPEIRKTLEENRFQHIYWCGAWRTFNMTARNAILNQYLQERIPGYQYDSLAIEYGDFRIAGLGGQPEAYTSMLASSFYDLAAPSIFHDNSNLTEGPYELGNVRLEKNDVVFDLGANIGIFSCVAASRGCRVYAFEPTPSTIKFLKINQALYGEHFQIASYAVCEKAGVLQFYCNASVDDEGATKNSLYFAHSGYEAIDVPAVTIDLFVQQNQLERVDFIKADIEGSERDMLRGARDTLARFAPKLALCTYHLPDDKEVLERLILEANSNYVIEHRWKKLYAYVPKKL